MIEETALVESTYNEEGTGEPYIVVNITKKSSSCTQCSVNSGCGTSILSQLFKVKEQKLYLKNTVGAKTGDAIIIAIDEPDFIKASLNTYILPLLNIILFAMMAVIVSNVFHFSDGMRDLSVIVLALLGLYLSRYFNLSFTKPEHILRLVKKSNPISESPLLYEKS